MIDENEAEQDAYLLDDGFLKRCFKDVGFPASRELILRCVDQEQDFAYGTDRTVNLHHLVESLDTPEFASYGDLMKAIKDRLAHPQAR
jgi:hypothetical protein